MSTYRTLTTVASSPHRYLLGLLLVIPLLAILPACGATRVEPRSFNSPEDAAESLVAAARTGETPRLLAVLGSEGQDLISSGDEVADRQRLQKFVSLYDQKHTIVYDGPDAATLNVGDTDWPLPIPLVHEAKSGWTFDTAAGREEILNRRIGQNELAAIQVCKAIGDAQREFALRDPGRNGLHEYAQQFASDRGRRNGLYWPNAPGEPPSPLGDLAAEAAAEGYTRKQGGPTPFHGYYYRILRAQGPHAPEGALDYVVKGRMILGFAVLAYPAEYGNSGVMTFMMGPDGVVYQKDLGKDTAKLATQIAAFDPGPGWTKAEPPTTQGQRLDANARN